MTYDEFKNSLIDIQDEICQELYHKNYEDLNLKESEHFSHSIATAWINYKMCNLENIDNEINDIKGFLNI